MDNGVLFVINNFEKSIDLCRSNPAYKVHLGKVLAEYHRIKAIKNTGNMIEYFSKFRENRHKYAATFTFLRANGLLTNEELADYLTANFPTEINNYSGIGDLVPGNVYTNQEITVTFSVAYMGGMRKSNSKNCLVLIAKHNNPLYDDQWTADGVMNYTGMGKYGDQSLTNAQNLTLNNLNTNGIKAYLFEAFKDNEYYYDGEVILDGLPFQADELDENKTLRKVWKFPLRRVDMLPGPIVPIDDVKAAEVQKIKEVHKESKEEIAKKAKAVNNIETTSTRVETIQRTRNQYVEEYTKIRANGVCDLCDQPAPFISKNGPYLESHHVVFLAEGGPDGIFNTVALCPNCHRKMHIVKSAKDKKHLIKKIKKHLKDDNDTVNLAQLKKLFNL